MGMLRIFSLPMCDRSIVRHSLARGQPSPAQQPKLKVWKAGRRIWKIIDVENFCHSRFPIIWINLQTFPNYSIHYIRGVTTLTKAKKCKTTTFGNENSFGIIRRILTQYVTLNKNTKLPSVMMCPDAGVHCQSGGEHRPQAQWLPQLHRRPGGLQYDSRRGEVLLHNLLLCLLYLSYYLILYLSRPRNASCRRATGSTWWLNGEWSWDPLAAAAQIIVLNWVRKIFINLFD